MKKALSLILALARALSLVACGQNQPSNDGSNSGSNGGKKTDTGKTDRKATGALGVLGSVLGALSAASGKLYPKKK